MSEPRNELDVDVEFDSSKSEPRDEPSAEAQRMALEPIDWNIDVEDLRKKTPEELTQHIMIMVEQLRRVSNALLVMAERYDKDIPPPTGQPSVAEIVGQALNPAE